MKLSSSNHGSFPVNPADPSLQAIEPNEWPALKVPKKITLEVRKLSPEITQELNSVRNRIPSLRTHE